MSVSIPEDLPGVDAANAELDRLMAADDAAEASTKKPDESATTTEAQAAADGQIAGQEGTQAAQEKTDTLAAAEKVADADKAKKPEPKDQKQQEPSRYQKARERQEKSWAELNAQKESLKRERDEFDKARTEHQQRLKEAEKDFSPEAYERAAEKFEKDGKFDMAEAARERAAELRKNPPAKQGENPATREWALKAGIDFPDLAKTNSPLQLRVAQLLKEEPEFKAHPKGIYLAARLASLEDESVKGKAAVASVAEKDKEITTLKGRITELEKLTAPGHGGAAAIPAAKSFDQKSDEEQFAELQQMAHDTGALR